MLSYNSERTGFPLSPTVSLVCEHPQSTSSSFKIQGSLPSNDTNAVVFISYIHLKMEYYGPSRQICMSNTDNLNTMSEHCKKSITTDILHSFK